jgi:hypothetical protein
MKTRVSVQIFDAVKTKSARKISCSCVAGLVQNNNPAAIRFHRTQAGFGKRLSSAAIKI